MEAYQTKPRRIVVCLDGTWETPYGNNYSSGYNAF